MRYRAAVENPTPSQTPAVRPAADDQAPFAAIQRLRESGRNGEAAAVEAADRGERLAPGWPPEAWA